MTVVLIIGGDDRREYDLSEEGSAAAFLSALDDVINGDSYFEVRDYFTGEVELSDDSRGGAA